MANLHGQGKSTFRTYLLGASSGKRRMTSMKATHQSVKSIARRIVGRAVKSHDNLWPASSCPTIFTRSANSCRLSCKCVEILSHKTLNFYLLSLFQPIENSKHAKRNMYQISRISVDIFYFDYWIASSFKAFRLKVFSFNNFWLRNWISSQIDFDLAT